MIRILNVRELRNQVFAERASKKSVQEPSTGLKSWQFDLIPLNQLIYPFLFYFSH